MELAHRGDWYKAGRTLVNVMAIDAAAPGGGRWLGFVGGEAAVLEDLDTMGAGAIAGMFG